jgi:hypothetical protein
MAQGVTEKGAKAKRENDETENRGTVSERIALLLLFPFSPFTLYAVFLLPPRNAHSSSSAKCSGSPPRKGRGAKCPCTEAALGGLQGGP